MIMTNKSNLVLPVDVNNAFINISNLIKNRYLPESAVLVAGQTIPATPIQDAYHDSNEDAYICVMRCRPELTLNDVNTISKIVETSFMAWGDAISIRYDAKDSNLHVVVAEDYLEQVVY